jgi:hypothetical protein
MLGREFCLEAFAYGVVHQLREEILDTPLLSLITWGRRQSKNILKRKTDPVAVGS